ncbi:MAG: UDP-N-acetylmuramoyl-tripeptide--D-alanyl-D-alanine ligase [Phycisphaerales bacterium]|nr:UDP-N-acetylmuramoyl-tripeptide--D-alanyl-D-alanine ligase [Phycisphaerales bacterium]
MHVDELYALFQKHPSVSTDTRNIKDGDLFFALRGANFDGNQFIAEAFSKGARYCIVDTPSTLYPDKTVVVSDVLATLQALAHTHRKKLSIPIIAITGSSGKTTTKELVASVLSKKYKCYATVGNLNNHIGIPLTLLRIPLSAEIAVIEMGASHQKEIEGYCRFVEPTHGIITNCGKAHLAGFGGEEGIRKGKGELFDYLRKNKGRAFVCTDYAYFINMVQGLDIMTYGQNKTATIHGVLVQSQPYLNALVQIAHEEVLIKTQLIGDYNLPNILAAVTVGAYFKVACQDIRLQIESYHPQNNRSQMIDWGNNKIILDYYNANPESMRLAILNFAQLQYAKKILLIGSMVELGADSLKEHQAIVDLINQYQWEQVLLVGDQFEHTKHPYYFVKDSTLARDWFMKQNFENCVFLLKGSRYYKMEKVIERV